MDLYLSTIRSEDLISGFTDKILCIPYTTNSAPAIHARFLQRSFEWPVMQTGPRTVSALVSGAKGAYVNEVPLVINTHAEIASSEASTPTLHSISTLDLLIGSLGQETLSTNNLYTTAVSLVGIWTHATCHLVALRRRARMDGRPCGHACYGLYSNHLGLNALPTSLIYRARRALCPRGHVKS